MSIENQSHVGASYAIDSDREWWVQQWLALLDKYRFKKRLERGRNYARQGNVLSINFEGDKIASRVQGSEPDPYQQSLWLDTFTDEDWDCIVQTMSEQAIFSAKLMAGEMPQNIEDVFAANGLRLFPFQLSEIRSRCSCPDKANPCKHIIAVYNLLGDRFADDPFVLFQLRGRSQEKIIAALRQIRGEEAKDIGAEELVSDANIEPSIELENFWDYDRQLESSLVVIAPPPDSNTILDVLGTAALAKQAKISGRSSVSIADAVKNDLDRIYQTVSQGAMKRAMEIDTV
ncbi:SWIM zinc finger family protein [Oscillatoriales cyanobacterium LEGE 11467]|uniref:SWIM zinc finger family protein n=1 Tax=Zarconia navalis LEGE 11467 TaxID=1828826 RepID=A0A928VSC7_9CYAN|nr:SWIM zinc finger family protein [Zarconia navalis]MBE9039246.1 SWIM zinc finger family protein [Zarconia navalis LEGE 11467]